MNYKKIIIAFVLVFQAISLNAYDSLVENEGYFKKAVEKSKLDGFGQNRIVAVLDSGINDDNIELRGKVIAEYDFTTGSKKAVDSNGHGTKMASVIAYDKYVENYKGGVYNVV